MSSESSSAELLSFQQQTLQLLEKVSEEADVDKLFGAVNLLDQVLTVSESLLASVLESIVGVRDEIYVMVWFFRLSSTFALIDLTLFCSTISFSFC